MSKTLGRVAATCSKKRESCKQRFIRRPSKTSAAAPRRSGRRGRRRPLRSSRLVRLLPSLPPKSPARSALGACPRRRRSATSAGGWRGAANGRTIAGRICARSWPRCACTSCGSTGTKCPHIPLPRRLGQHTASERKPAPRHGHKKAPEAGLMDRLQRPFDDYFCALTNDKILPSITPLVAQPATSDVGRAGVFVEKSIVFDA